MLQEEKKERFGTICWYSKIFLLIL